ncbi:hypothetical protein [Spirosoma koreense]
MFDIKSVMAECRAYIDTIADYQIEVTGKRIATADAITEYISKASIKVLLIEFLFACKDEISKGELHLLRHLRSRREYFQAIQGHNISQLNEMISHNSGEEKARFEDQKQRLFNFYHHNYTLIDLITARLTDIPLNEYLQFRLRNAGLEWIINAYNTAVTPNPTNGLISNDSEIEKMHKVVRDVLAPLKEKNQQRNKIMSDSDFDRLIIYTQKLVIEDTLPHDINPINQVNISAGHLRYTFYILHRELFGTRSIRKSFIDFLHAVFSNKFKEGEKSSTKSHFSDKPKSYEADLPVISVT